VDGGAQAIAEAGCNGLVAAPAVVPVVYVGVPGPSQVGGNIAAGTYVLDTLEEYNPCTTGHWAPVPWGRVLSFAPALGTLEAAESFLDTTNGHVQSETSNSLYRTDGSSLSLETFCATGSIAEPETSPGGVTYTATPSQLVVENEADCPPGGPGLIDVFTYGKQ
jgi:hypothetical protein